MKRRLIGIALLAAGMLVIARGVRLRQEEVDDCGTPAMSGGCGTCQLHRFYVERCW